METLEPATLRDIPQLADLLTELFTQEADFQPERAKQERALRLLIESPQIGRVFVARDGTDVLGMVSLLFTVSTAEGGYVCWLEDMVVRADRRGTGLGSRLLSYAITAARQAGMTRITLLTDRLNTGAIRFYQRQGFQPSAMTALRLFL